MNEDLAAIAARKDILTPPQQRVLWARVSTLKRILVRNGLITHEEFEALANAMVKDIDQKVYDKLAAELGMPDYEETVQEEADRTTDSEP